LRAWAFGGNNCGQYDSSLDLCKGWKHDDVLCGINGVSSGTTVDSMIFVELGRSCCGCVVWSPPKGMSFLAALERSCRLVLWERIAR